MHHGMIATAVGPDLLLGVTGLHVRHGHRRSVSGGGCSSGRSDGLRLSPMPHLWPRHQPDVHENDRSEKGEQPRQPQRCGRSGVRTQPVHRCIVSTQHYLL